MIDPGTTSYSGKDAAFGPGSPLGIWIVADCCGTESVSRDVFDACKLYHPSTPIAIIGKKLITF